MLHYEFWVFAVAWQTEWVIPAAGVATAVVALGVGRSIVRGRRRSQQTDDVATKNLLTDPYFHGSLTEQREAARRAGNSVGIQVRDPEEKGPEQSGWVVDRSVGGICLQLDNPLEVGTVWQIRPRNAPTGTPWVTVEVRNCVMECGAWKIGCKFEKTPTWNVLMLFG
jgi:hypothetical protein